MDPPDEPIAVSPIERRERTALVSVAVRAGSLADEALECVHDALCTWLAGAPLEPLSRDSALVASLKHRLKNTARGCVWLLAAFLGSQACAVTAARVTHPTSPQLKAASMPPRELVLPDRNYWDETKEQLLLVESHIYPLGWSRDGLFAYAYEAPDEACGCYFFRMFVIDLRTNSERFKSVYNSFKEPEPHYETLAQLWAARGRGYDAKLRELGIERADAVVLSRFGAGVRPIVESETVGEDSPEGFAHIEHYQLSLACTFCSAKAHGNACETAPLGISSSRATSTYGERWADWDARPLQSRPVRPDFWWANLDGVPDVYRDVLDVSCEAHELQRLLAAVEHEES